MLDGPEQAAMFADLDGDAELVDRQLGRKPLGWKGGRVPGARNRATRDVIDFVRRAGTDPLLWMSKIASMELDELRAWGGFKRKSDAAEFQRKVVADYRATLYPGNTVADILKAALGDAGILQVIGFMAMARTSPADAGAAPPDIHGRMRILDADARVPVEPEQKQGVDHAPDA